MSASQEQDGCRLVPLPADAEQGLWAFLVSQCFEDLFSWQRLAVIFVVEAAEILAGTQGWLWGAGGKGAAEIRV